jgi:hypothetical protein
MATDRQLFCIDDVVCRQAVLSSESVSEPPVATSVQGNDGGRAQIAAFHIVNMGPERWASTGPRSNSGTRSPAASVAGPIHHEVLHAGSSWVLLRKFENGGSTPCDHEAAADALSFSYPTWPTGSKKSDYVDGTGFTNHWFSSTSRWLFQPSGVRTTSR